MHTRQPTTREEVEGYLNEEVVMLHPEHQRRFAEIRVTPRRLPVEDAPGEYVYVVAEYQGKVLYWSDIEEGWELEQPTVSGCIVTRGCNQFDLSHIMYQIFGDPDVLRE